MAVVMVVLAGVVLVSAVVVLNGDEYVARFGFTRVGLFVGRS